MTHCDLSKVPWGETQVLADPQKLFVTLRSCSDYGNEVM